MPKQYQRVGFHASAAGGLENAPENAHALDAECFQFFSRSPRGGGAKPISNEQAKLFRERCEQYDFESYIHAPYYVNFASKNNRIYHGTIAVLREELERGSKLGVKYLVTHLGSAKEHVTNPASIETPQSALDQAVKGIKEMYKGNPKFTTQLLLEISAGAGSVVGDTFEELGYLLKHVGRKDIHVCLDTCHMFASGYDLRKKEALNETMKLFRKHVGISHLKLVHMNDSKADLGARTDRHEHIGKGKIGNAGLKAVLTHPDFQKVNFILETKHDSLLSKDLAFLKKHRTAS
ncbi:MAG: deoxyribonuclease IV [Candidatus Andersenbacteria bacterium]